MIKKVEHVALLITDMDKTLEFYETVFGFKLRARGENKTREMAFIRNPDLPGFEIELMRDLYPQGDYEEQGIVNHLAFTVDNIEEAIQYYRSKGIEFNSETPNIAIDGAKTIFFFGPNREFLQLVEPVSRND